jgi:hypothetical protein
LKEGLKFVSEPIGFCFAAIGKEQPIISLSHEGTVPQMVLPALRFLFWTQAAVLVPPVAIQLLQVHVCQQGRADCALRDAKFCPLKEAMLHQSCFAEAFDEFQEALIGNAFCQALQQNVMLDIVIGTFNVPFNDPEMLALIVAVAIQSSATVHRFAPWPEAIGAIEEVAFPDRFKDHLTQHLHHAIFAGGAAKWTHFPLGFWNVDTTNGNWAKALLSKRLLNLPYEGKVCLWWVLRFPGRSVDSCCSGPFVRENQGQGAMSPLFLAHEPVKVIKCVCGIVHRF